MVDLTKKGKNNTAELTIDMANQILSEIITFGNADLAVKNGDSSIDPENYNEVDKQIDKFIEIIRNKMRTETTTTKAAFVSSLSHELLNVEKVLNIDIDGRTWDEYKASFKVFEEI